MTSEQWILQTLYSRLWTHWGRLWNGRVAIEEYTELADMIDTEYARGYVRRLDSTEAASIEAADCWLIDDAQWLESVPACQDNAQSYDDAMAHAALRQYGYEQ